MPTALVTGATSGIGAAFARALATSGHRLVVVARDTAALAELPDRLVALGSPGVEVLPADLAGEDGRAAVAERLAVGGPAAASGSTGDDRPPVDLLVNNAGFTLGRDFGDADADDLERQLSVNVRAVLRLTHAALGSMRARRSGAIVNVASVAAMLPGRGSTYSADKAWVLAFTEGLAERYRTDGVRLLALCPGFVPTDFHRRAGINMSAVPDWQYVGADAVVREALADLARGKVVSVPGRLYPVITTAARLAPRPLVRKLAARIASRDRT
jgi:short-subunit dehydrogenase